MLTTDHVILLLMGLAAFVAVLLLIYFQYREKWSKDGVIEAPLLKKAPVIEHAAWGSLIVTGFEPYAPNNSYGVMHCVTESGSQRSWELFEDELLPINNVTNAVGERAFYKYVPNKSRVASIIHREAEIHEYAATAASASRRANAAQAEAAVLKANQGQLVTETIENAAKVIKQATPKAKKGE